MVGTSPILSPARRHSATWLRISITVRATGRGVDTGLDLLGSGAALMPARRAAAKSALTHPPGLLFPAPGQFRQFGGRVSEARVIVIGNEKGGAGKTTIVVHVATAIMHAGARLAVFDLDLRQQSTAHFFANRAAWAAAEGADLAMPVSVGPASAETFEAELAEARRTCDVVLIDTPGADTGPSRLAHQQADLVVTPMNDSFVDFDMLGVVDPVSLEVKRPSLYAEAVWEARKTRAASSGRQIDWVVLRNRLAPVEARNRKRLDERVKALSRRVGFRMGNGLRDRVIYRELFPFGLTVADLAPGIRPVPVSMSHIAARQEIRMLLHTLGLGEAAGPADAA